MIMAVVAIRRKCEVFFNVYLINWYILTSMSDEHPAEEATYYAALEALFLDVTDEKDLYETIVNAPFHNPVFTTSIDLGVVVLLLVNKQTKTIDRIALSNTPQAHGAVKMSEKPFNTIKIPVGYKGNIIAESIATGTHHHTSDWQFLFAPALSMQAARFNQAGAGVECSYVYPLLGTRNGGALIFSYYQPVANIKSRHRNFMQFYSQLVAAKLTAS